MTLIERLHYPPPTWADALDDRQAAADALIAQQVEIALLRATLNSHRAERERLLQRIAQVTLAHGMRVTT
jgi:hypothetical protein